jgi:hypothetical protein
LKEESKLAKYQLSKGKLTAAHVEDLLRLFARDGDANSSHMVRKYFVDGSGYEDIAQELGTTRMNVYNQIRYFATKCPLLQI